MFLSVGHDEYWSGTQRAQRRGGARRGRQPRVLQRQRGLLEDALGEQHRRRHAYRRSSYKETHANAKIDPHADVWTGTWRDPRPSTRRRRPARERADRHDLHRQRRRPRRSRCPPADGKLRFWRDTAVAQRCRPAQTATLGRRHARLRVGRGPRQRLPAAPAWSACRRRPSAASTSCRTTAHTYAHRHGHPPPDALPRRQRRRRRTRWCSARGTVQWSWGLDADHDRGSSGAERLDAAGHGQPVRRHGRPAQLAADRAARRPARRPTRRRPRRRSPSPAAGRDGRAAGSPVTDPAAPRPTPAAGASARVEVSVDDGASWHPATGRETWSYTWTPTDAGRGRPSAPARPTTAATSARRRTRAPSPSAARSCPCTLFGGDARRHDGQRRRPRSRSACASAPTRPARSPACATTAAPAGPAAPSATSGRADGTQLAAVPFPASHARRLAAGALPQPVRVTADTTYVASYFSRGRLLRADTATSSRRLRRRAAARAGSTAGPNGVYTLRRRLPRPPASDATNYWADVVFAPDDGTPPAVTAVTPADGSTGVDAGDQGDRDVRRAARRVHRQHHDVPPARRARRLGPGRRHVRGRRRARPR